jgi:hypothetical protein
VFIQYVINISKWSINYFYALKGYSLLINRPIWVYRGYSTSSTTAVTATTTTATLLILIGDLIVVYIGRLLGGGSLIIAIC